MSSIFGMRRMLVAVPLLALATVLAPSAQATHGPHSPDCAANNGFPVVQFGEVTDPNSTFVYVYDKSLNPRETWICFHTPVRGGVVVIKDATAEIIPPDADVDGTPTCTTPILDLAGLLNVSVRVGMTSAGQLQHFLCATVNNVGASVDLKIVPPTAPVTVQVFFD